MTLTGDLKALLTLYLWGCFMVGCVLLSVIVLDWLFTLPTVEWCIVLLLYLPAICALMFGGTVLIGEHI